MRKTSVIVMGALLLLAGKAFATGIQGSAHDFTITGDLAKQGTWGLDANGNPLAGMGGVTELCQTCHTPHRPVLNVPLWAHSLSSATYTLYSDNNDYGNSQGYTGLDASAYDATSIGKSRSRLCLSCHDGTVAVNSFAGMDANGNGDFFMTDDHTVTGSADPTNPLGGFITGGGPGKVGQQLSLKGSHPVGVKYEQIRTAPGAEFYNIFDANGVAAYGSGKLKLENGRVQCTTCHNPHNKNDRMLAVNMTSDYLCTKCHNK